MSSVFSMTNSGRLLWVAVKRFDVVRWINSSLISVPGSLKLPTC